MLYDGFSGPRAMATVYLSSTYEDLLPYRRVVLDSLLGLGHRVLAMEHGLAADERPLDRCLSDVASCDLYIGVFAWRYGHVPAVDNPNRSSITELEYRHARGLNKPTLIFLLHEDVPWLRKWEDSATGDPRPIETLRQHLQANHTVGFFSSEQELGRLASNAVTQWEQSRAMHQAAAETSTEPQTLTAIPSSYFEWLKRECGSVELLGLRLQRGQSVRIGSVYVPVHSTRGLDDPQLRHTTRLLDLVNERSIYVSGAAGAGKSTFCRWLAWLLASGSLPPRGGRPEIGQEHFPELLRGKVPILIRLREFHQPQLVQRDVTAHMFESAMKAWVNERKPGGIEWPAVTRQIHRGGAVLMFDGIDEAPPAARDGLVKGLGECVPAWTASGNRVVATSRPYAVSQSSIRQLNLPHVPVSGLPESIQRLLVSRWFDILADDPESGRNIADALLTDLRDRRWLRPLAENPLLLTSICIVYGQGRRLPEDKYELYDRIVETVLHNRFDAGLVAIVRNRLAVVAHGMHVGSEDEPREVPAAQTTIKEIDRFLQSYQQDRVGYTEDAFMQVTDARDRLLSDSGLLQPVEDRGGAFFHFSFQEFLAAERQADVDGDRILDVFREHGAKPEWRNTLSFLFGAQLANRVSPRRAVAVLLGIRDQFVATSDAVRALLTADCVEILRARQVTLEDEALRPLREACLGQMRSQRPAVERCMIGEALGRIGDHRFLKSRWWLADDGSLGFVEIPEGPVSLRVRFGGASTVVVPRFLVARYPVTVAQFRAFVDDRAHNRGFAPRDPASIRGVGNHPVVRISPEEATAYGEWLTRKLASATPAASPSLGDMKARLPTEAEWTRAAGGPARARFPWGSHMDANHLNVASTGIGGPSAVGCFSLGASPFRIEEMSGNVWEWTRRSISPAARLPSGRRGRVVDQWVGRGSAFDRGDGSVMSTLVPDPRGELRNASFGFRLVLSDCP